MVSLRFPFPFPKLPPHGGKPNASSTRLLTAASAAAAAAVGIAVSLKSVNYSYPFTLGPSSSNTAPPWASVSLADAAPSTEVEPKTGAAFPSVIDGTRRLLGIGLRKKSVMGLKNIDVYAFGVYAEESDAKLLSQKFGSIPISEVQGSKDFYAAILDQDLRMTVRLQIVYGRLKIGSVRGAFEESVGSRLQKLGGHENKELLQRFTSLFKDEYKLPRGSIIELSRDHGHVLMTKIDGKEVGRIQSKLLCQSILDLYIGEDSFDRVAKENILLGLASLVHG